MSRIRAFFKRSSNVLAASVLAAIQALPILAISTPANATSPDKNQVSYWCSDDDGGVKFDTGAVGTHTVGPVTITIVDNGKTELSNATGTGVTITQIVIKGGSTGGNGGDGNQSYVPPFNFPLAAPNNNGGQQSDISHVIVCYDNNPTSIKVIKDAQPNDDQNFNFFFDKIGSSGSDDNFILDDNGTEIIVKSSKTFSNLLAATYVVTEQNIPSGWVLDDIVCTGGANVTRDLNNEKVTIVLSTGENVVCTFVNQTVGKITVNKKVDADGNGVYEGSNPTANSLGFDWGLDNETPARDMGTSALDVPTGSHTVTEDSVAGFIFKGWYYSTDTQYSCANPRGTTLPINVTVDKNDHKQITLCNQKTPTGKVKLIKSVTNDNGGTLGVDDFGLTINGQSVTSGQELEFDGGTQVTINEAGATGYAFVSITGTGCPAQLGGTVTVVANQTIICTITNDDQPAWLTAIKYVVNDNGGNAVVSDFPLSATDSNANIFVLISSVQKELNAGSYTLAELAQAGYSASDWGGDCAADGTITLLLGQSYTCEITNDDVAPSLTVVKKVINDDGGTATVSSFDIENNGTDLSFGAGVVVGDTTTYTSTPTVSSNVSYTLSEDDFAGYTEGTWSCTDGTQGVGLTATVTLDEDEDVTCTIINDDQPGELILIKDVINDDGGSLTQDNFTPTVNGTDSTWGSHVVSAGTYDVSELSAAALGYSLNGISCYVTGSSATGVSNPVSLNNGESVSCEITNDDEPGEVIVTKFHDIDEDGNWDDNEPALSGWEMNLDGTSLTTDANGEAVFEDVDAGDHTLSETQQNGWELSAIYCDTDEIRLLDTLQLLQDSNRNQGDVWVGSGETVYCFVGNHQTPNFTLEKTNNVWPTPVTRGSLVTYTLIVTVPEDSGRIYSTEGSEVTVTDLLPEHFSYQAGTWTASSSIRGNLKAAGVTPEPDYSGPGPAVWNLTDGDFLAPGEVVTLTYIAKVGDTVAAGEYDNIAFALGYERNGDPIFANGEEDPFVDSTVAVVVFTPQVLGESTLANTGIGVTGFAIAAAALLVAALLVSLKMTRRSSAVAAMVLVSALTMGAMASTQAFAATATTTRIQKLTSPGTEANFTIDYQVMTVGNECEFDVSLLQNGSVVNSETVSAANGDSGDFPVSLSANGNYTFQVVATATSGECDSDSSDQVTYVLNKSVASTTNATTTSTRRQSVGVSSTSTTAPAVQDATSDEDQTDTSDQSEQSTETDNDTNPWWYVLGALVILGGAAYFWQQRQTNDK